MRRSSLANSKFKPPKMVKLSTSPCTIITQPWSPVSIKKEVVQLVKQHQTDDSQIIAEVLDELVRKACEYANAGSEASPAVPTSIQTIPDPDCYATPVSSTIRNRNILKSRRISSFKTPTSLKPSRTPVNKMTPQEMEIEKLELERQIKELEERGHKVEELHAYINVLHKYNKFKDIAQYVMGKLAFRFGTTAKEIAEMFEAPSEAD